MALFGLFRGKGPAKVETGRCWMDYYPLDSTVYYDLLLYGEDIPARKATIYQAVEELVRKYSRSGAWADRLLNGKMMVACHKSTSVDPIHREVKAYLTSLGISLFGS